MFSSLSVIFSYSLPPYPSLCPSLLQENTCHCASKWSLGTHTHTHTVCMSTPYTYSTMQLYTALMSTYVHAYLLYLKMHTDTHRERETAHTVLVWFLHTYVRTCSDCRLYQVLTSIVEYSVWELVLALPPLPVLHWCCECQCLGLPLPLDELRNELVGEKDVGC